MMVSGRVSSPRFVGRRDELARLEALLDAARSGRPVTALLTGDAGIGKSRLADELSRRATAVGAQVFTGRCVDVAEDVLPFGPLVDILDQIVRAHGVGRVLELAGPTGDELARLAPVIATGDGRVPETTRASATRLYQALAGLLTGLAARQPLVLVTEDLHWVDRSTRDLLALLVRGLRGPALLLLTMRSDELPATDPLHRFVAELGRSGATRIPLAGLDRADQARQIGAIVGVPPTTATVDRIYGRAEGNPFFAEELLTIDHDRDLPSGIVDLLVTKVRSLPDDAIEVAQVGALAGRRVGYGLLAAATGFGDERLETALRTLVDHHLLIPEGSRDGFAFRHALLRDAIQATVLPGQATRLHTRLAEVLSERPELASADGYGIAARIAHHWHLAGDAPRTLVTSLAAASAAEDALAWPAALTNYERAISLFDDVGDAGTLLEQPRYRILWDAAETAHLSAHPRRAAELIRAAIDAIEADPPDAVDVELHRAYLHERLGRYLWMAADGIGAIAAYERAVELAPLEDPTRWHAAIYSGYGQILMLQGRFRESIQWCERAIGICQVVERARSTEGHARNNLGVDLAYLGDVDGGIEHLRAARAIAEEEFDDVDDIARAIVNLHTVLFEAGRLEEAAAVAIDGIETVDALGLSRRKGVWCRCDAAETLLRLGRTDEARSLIEQAVGLQPAGIDALRTWLLQAVLHLCRGEVEDAERVLDEARELGGSILDGQINGPLYTALTEARLQREPWAALELADEGHARLLDEEDAAHCVPLQTAAVRAASEAAVAARAAGDGAAARRAVAIAEDWLGLARAAVARDPADKPAPIAHLRTAEAELTRAQDRSSPIDWTAAAEAWHQLGVPYREVYCLFRLGEALLGEGQRDVAADPLSRAEEEARRIGADGLHAAVLDLARRARLDLEGSTPDVTAVEAASDLTPREREVLQLVAQGQTDRQIGERLFISHRTVERHVSNILAKLHASTRTEASAIAHRDRIVSV